MRPKVSVIIPVFNAATTIEGSVSSVLANTCRNWELILVNDGSTDGSAAICQKLEAADSRIKYFEKENGGPGDARNFGMERATGDYIMFLDADDRFKPEMIQTMLDTVVKRGADVVMCAMEAENSSGEIGVISHSMPLGEAVTGDNAVSTFLRSLLRDCSGRTPSLCNKIYSADFLWRNGLHFEPWQVHGEDWAFNVNLFETEVPRMVFLDDSLYVYKHRGDSISRNYVRPPFQHPFYTLELSLRLNSKYGLEEEEYIYTKFISETFDDLILAFRNETPQAASSICRAFLAGEKGRNILKKSSALPLGWKQKFIAFVFRHGGFITGQALLKLLSRRLKR